MIAFWVTREGRNCIDAYLSNRGQPLAHCFETPYYDDVGPRVRMSAGAQIFSTLDHLTSAQHEVARLLWAGHAVGAPHAVRLNQPGRVLLRFDLLTRLHEHGINSFRVYPADGADPAMRYPVFVRERDWHNGPLTDLLDSPRALTRAVAALALRGYARRSLMVVEFCDASGADCLIRKFAAFKVGARIIPAHLFASRHWMLKSAENELTDAVAREEEDYLQRNPHESWLRRVFDVAGIDFGRIDYGIAKGVPQAWEINLNPTIGRPADFERAHNVPPHLQQIRERGRRAFHTSLREAFEALDPGHSSGAVVVDLPPPLLARVRREMRAQAARRRVLNGVRSLYANSRLGRPVRTVFARLFPRG